jgi:2-methylisocitrate lyase-like PEP mutase family enzyme
MYRRREGERMTAAPGEQFRALLNEQDIVLALGAYDAQSARLLEQAGGALVYVSGSAVSTSVHGGPDVGLTTMTEMVDRVRGMTGAVDVPVFSDADTGYGGALNVRRTVEEFERAGVAAVHIEDQTFPKRCGHFEGKGVVDRTEMLARIRAAVDAADDLVVCARTDAAATEGMDEAIDRARACAEAGAELLFVEAPESRADLERVGKTLGDHRLLVNLTAGGKTPVLPAEDLDEMGFDVALYPSAAQKATIHAVRSVYDDILAAGTSEGVFDRLVTWEERNEVTGLAELQALEDRYVREATEQIGERES